MNNKNLKQRTFEWVESLAVPGPEFGRFKMSASTDDTIFTSCFAAFLYDLLGGFDTLSDEQKQQWLDYILSYQDEATGLFMDNFDSERNLSAAHDLRYVTWQLTTFCISAVTALGGKLRFPLKFIEQENLRDPARIAEILEGLNWKNPWGAGNLAMFLGIMLIADVEYHGRDPASDAAVKAYFDWHDGYQNRNTGFWGEGRVNDYHNGLFGAYHQYLLYFYCARELHCKQQIMDRTISFQNIDGMFAPQMGGGACEDVDAIDTLVQCYLATGYRKDDVESVLRKNYDALMALEAPGGGFIWGVKKRYGPGMFIKFLFSFLRVRDLHHWVFLNRRFIREQQLNPLKPRHPEGWVSVPIPIDESDLFSTWFRVLTIAYASMVIDTPESGIDWHYLDAPGLGWFEHPDIVGVNVAARQGGVS